MVPGQELKRAALLDGDGPEATVLAEHAINIRSQSSAGYNDCLRPKVP
ncbi:hypothetical protein [Arthrobacter sp. NA-172]